MNTADPAATRLELWFAECLPQMARNASPDVIPTFGSVWVAILFRGPRVLPIRLSAGNARSAGKYIKSRVRKPIRANLIHVTVHH